MKRFWLVLLSLGLVMAFSASAFAVDVKLSGDMFVGGVYVNKTNLKKDTTTDGMATSYYYQRLRVGAEFVVTPGISVVTRADILEKVWGQTRSTQNSTGATLDSQGTAAENENIAFDMAYIRATLPIGRLEVGQIPFGTWGTVFNNSGPKGLPGVSLFVPAGDMLFGGYIFKLADNSYTAINTTQVASDVDYDLYLLFGKYTAKSWEAGLLVGYLRNATTKAASSYTKDGYAAFPYFKATIGPVYLEGEVNAAWGKAKRYESAASSTNEVDEQHLSGYLSGVVTMGPAYVGGTVAYYSGDDPADTAKVHAESLFNGIEWSPTLIMWNRDRAYNFGTLNGNDTGTSNTAGFSSYFQNAFFWQVMAGVKPTDKLDIRASLSNSTADQLPRLGWLSKDMGWEVDLTATYKITNNLSYLLGGGYLLTGDYFKGTSPTASVSNDYLIINKLTLTF